MSHLASKRFSCPRPVPNLEGELLSVVKLGVFFRYCHWKPLNSTYLYSQVRLLTDQTSNGEQYFNPRTLTLGQIWLNLRAKWVQQPRNPPHPLRVDVLCTSPLVVAYQYFLSRSLEAVPKELQHSTKRAQLVPPLPQLWTNFAEDSWEQTRLLQVFQSAVSLLDEISNNQKY